MLDEEDQKILGDWFKTYLKDYDELWKSIKFRQRLKKIVVPSLNSHGFDAFTHLSDRGGRGMVEFSRTQDKIIDIIYMRCLRNILDRYRRPGMSGVGVLGEFRVHLRLVDSRTGKDLIANWESLRFTPPPNVLPWIGEWPFKDAATLDQLLTIFAVEFDKRGIKIFELARRGAPRDELVMCAGEAARPLSEDEWDKSPWSGGDIVVKDSSFK